MCGATRDVCFGPIADIPFISAIIEIILDGALIFQ
jgi:hypothetical protein